MGTHSRLPALRMTASQKASLLGIPTELRLAVYDVVLNTDLDCRILEGWESGHGRQGFWSRPRRNEQARLDVAWCNLLLTCKTIHDELEPHMSQTLTGVYIADIERRSQHSLGSFTWRRLDCHPRNVKQMIVRFKHEGDFKSTFWGDAAPHPIVRELFQTLNVLLHCGPRMDIKRELPEPMHIDKLAIIPVLPDLIPGTHPSYRKTNFYRRHRISDQLRDFASNVCQQGIVYGLVDRFEVMMGKKAFEPGTNIWGMDVEDLGDWEMPGHWHGYGFEWGMDQFRQASTQVDS